MEKAWAKYDSWAKKLVQSLGKIKVREAADKVNSIRLKNHLKAIALMGAFHDSLGFTKQEETLAFAIICGFMSMPDQNRQCIVKTENDPNEYLK